MNKDEIEAMGKFFRQAFDMSNGSPPDVKYEMTQKAKDALKEIEKRIETYGIKLVYFWKIQEVFITSRKTNK